MGSVAAFSGNTLPAGWLLCDGSAVSRETYATLFNIIGTTYGTGDGSTTFALPDLTDRFIEGSASSGTVKSAGLPNINGSFRIAAYSSTGNAITGAYNGSFYANGQSGLNITKLSPSGTGPAHVTAFDASRSSSIYGNSNTVQPPAVTMRYAIYSGFVSKKLWLRTI